MTRDKIIKALDWHPSVCQGPQSLLVRIERVVAQAEAQEREACAKVCETYETACIDQNALNTAKIFTHCAATIRAMGQA